MGADTNPPSAAIVRARAANVVSEVVHNHRSLDATLVQSLPKVAPIDRALLQELCFGTVRWYWLLDALLGRLLHRPLRRKDRAVEALALVGLYQLMATRVPVHAAVHSTVEACAVLKKSNLKGLVNSVLRHYMRSAEALTMGLAPEVRAAHPLWLWDALGEAWGSERSSVVEANNTRPPMTLRINQARIGRQAYLQRLTEASCAYSTPSFPVTAVTLEQPRDVSEVPGFTNGLVSVQDASAQFAADLIDVKPGMRVLDACAAPGGKLCHMLERFPGIHALAVDIDPNRARRVDDNLQRLGLEAEVRVADVIETDSWCPPGCRFDVILVDAPCSATGVVRRHPDIKVLRRRSDVDDLLLTQVRILRAMWGLLKVDGLLLYVTCSLLPEENVEQIAGFLGERPDARELEIRLPAGHPQAHGWQILPGSEGGDGFYYALVRKVR